MKHGTFSKEMLRKLIQSGSIADGSEETLNPGSMNLRLTGEMFRLDRFQQPRLGQSVWSMMKEVGYMMHHPSHPSEVGIHYVARLQESIYDLPKGLYGMANPRSTTGRQFVHTRLLVDGDPRLDQMAKGYKGNLWALIRCLAFPEVFGEGDELNQLRIFNKDTRLNREQLKKEYERNPLLFDEDGPIPFEQLKIDHDGAVYLTLNIAPKDGPAAYVTKSTRKAAYFSGSNNKDDFFETIEKGKTGLDTEENRFYITTTKEIVRLPNHIAAEIAPIDERIIEARNNFAGFVDQGFFGEITCEIAVREPMTLTDGQTIARIRFEYVIGNEIKDGYIGSYQGQMGPRLAKNFV